MKDLTRRQLHAISLAFYEAQAEAFDASRVDLPWPGWERVLAEASRSPLSVLDIGCGNGRFAAFLHGRGRRFEYIGTDSNAALLDAAKERLTESLGPGVEFRCQDFLGAPEPGAELPAGPFSLVVLMGVLHHVPSCESRLALLHAAAKRVAPGGLLAYTAWQFGGRPRFKARQVEWGRVGRVLDEAIDTDDLEPGDLLLRFGDDPDAPPRYCHQVSDAEFEGWPGKLRLDPVDDFRADGAEGDLNRYQLLRRPLPL